VILPCIPPGHWMSIVLSLLNNAPFKLLYTMLDEATVMFVRSEQFSNAPSPMLVTL